MTLYMGLLETQGNQAYIYATNRERNARGASELLQAATTTWVLHAVGMCEENESLTLSRRTEILRAQKTDVLDGGPGTYVVIATSGRAVLLSDSRDSLVDVISKVTTRALKEAPGLIVVGAVVEIDESKSDPFGTAQREAAERIGLNLSSLPPTARRFQQLPLVALCTDSGLPAGASIRRGGEPLQVSHLLATQHDFALDSHRRLRGVLSVHGVEDRDLAEDVDDLTDRSSWRAVVHADGNGVGAVFIAMSALLRLDDATFSENLQNWSQGYREFSLGLELATERAFANAVARVGAQHTFPVLLGGDDITVEVSAGHAREFTTEYLRAFAENTVEAASSLRKFVPESLHNQVPTHFSAAAGIAVVKRSFPFSSAYELAEDLLASAKTTKKSTFIDGTPVSAFDFHVLYDSTHTGLGDIRGGRKSDDGIRLWGGPYLAHAPADNATGYCTGADLSRLVGQLALLGRRRQTKLVAAAVAENGAAADRALENMAATDRETNLDPVRDLVLDTASGRTLLLDAIDILDVEGTPRLTSRASTPDGASHE